MVINKELFDSIGIKEINHIPMVGVDFETYGGSGMFLDYATIKNLYEVVKATEDAD